MLAVRRAALSRFGENAIKRGMPMAQIEEVLVPLYLHHRYQVDAAANVVGGMHYIYAMRGDGREPAGEGHAQVPGPVPAHRVPGQVRPGRVGAQLLRRGVEHF